MEETDVAARLKTLRRQRGNIQRHITTFTKKLDAWKDDESTRDSDLLVQSLESLQKTFDKFDSIQDEIEGLEEPVDAETDQRTIMQEHYDIAVTRARKYLREIVINTPERDLGVKTHVSTPPESLSGHSTQVKLPTISLPEFDGSLEGWASFFDLFSSLIDQNEKLNSVKKLFYLKSALKGKAADLLKNVSTIESNYQLALDLLKDKFDCPRRVARTHFSNLREYPKLQKDTPKALGDLVDVFRVNLRALKNLDAPIEHWSIPIIDLILTKIGEKTAYEWEIKLTDNKMPHYDHLLNYLEKRANSMHLAGKLEAGENSKSHSHRKDSRFTEQKRSALVVTNENKQQCRCCDKEFHPLYLCPCFKKLGTPDRRDYAKKLGACFNCLKYKVGNKESHLVGQCPIKNSTCRNCTGTHHTSLCLSTKNLSSEKTQQNHSDHSQDGREGSAHVSGSAPQISLVATDVDHSSKDSVPTVLLGSALIEILGRDGQYHKIHSVVDSAASSSFISHAAAQRVGLKYRRTYEPVSGIGGGETGVRGQLTCYIRSRFNPEPVLPTDTMVIKKIVDLPKAYITEHVRQHFAHLPLADPHFGTAREVEFLIGADIFPFIFTGEKKMGPSGTLSALNSIFGYVIIGRLGNRAHGHPGQVALITTPGSGESANTDTLLRKFWEIEETPTKVPAHPDDVIAETMFKEQHYRLPSGCYVVPILLRECAPPLGDSKTHALQRLHSMERRLEKSSVLSTRYADFLDEYESLTHMEPVALENHGKAAYYIPHHAVFREDSTTTKLRVVFDASQKSRSGISLNDILYSGPKLQNDVFDVITRFRLHQKVFTCDISKMFRQILIRPDQRKYQHIFWRRNGQVLEFV
ncbi:uncharacterized protein [Bemisia tabaci]|uniref:uncharacterized protein n=1 Tax=Bemisia tabaci TaxID=7038 RepID=UPI003B280C27